MAFYVHADNPTLLMMSCYIAIISIAIVIISLWYIKLGLFIFIIIFIPRS